MGKFEVKKAKTGLMFNLLAKNKQVIGTSEIYNKKASCLRGVASVKKNGSTDKVEDQTAKDCKKLTCPKYVIKAGKSGAFHFNLLAINGQVILTSETYKTRAACVNGIKSVQTNAPDAEVVEV